MTANRLRAIVFDCAHPASLARFWAAALGYRVRDYDDAELARLRARGIDDPEDDPSVVIDAPDGGPSVWFNRVPEAKSVKNRVHVDVDLRDRADLDALEARGARVLRPPGGEPGQTWAVMADPEGNEFCAFLPG